MRRLYALALVVVGGFGIFAALTDEPLWAIKGFVLAGGWCAFCVGVKIMFERKP